MLSYLKSLVARILPATPESLQERADVLRLSRETLFKDADEAISARAAAIAAMQRDIFKISELQQNI
jgi:hypothetical protein